MNLQRGDVVLGPYPFASGIGAKRRPLLVIQANRDNQRMTSTIVAQISTTLHRANEPTHYLISVASPEGRLAGLLHDSVVSCNNLATITGDRIEKVIGHLSPATMAKINDCLKAALDLP